MGELPHQGFECMMLEDFRLELAINSCHPSKKFYGKGEISSGTGQNGLGMEGGQV